MATRRRTAFGTRPTTVGTLVAALVLLAAVAPAQAAASYQATESRTDSWTTVDKSVTRAPDELAATVGPNERARVVGLRDNDGVPTFDVTPVRGREQAEAVVSETQAEDDVLAVVVEEKQKLVKASDANIRATNDPLASSQWALHKLEADAAWITTQGAGQTVAVVDSGTSREPDLAPQLLTGWDFIARRAGGNNDRNGHGTHVAGIIAATSGNTLGGSGLAPQTKILPIRALGADGAGYWSDIANGIVYAVNQGAGVINLSLGSHSGDANVQAAIEYAIAQGRVVVAAVGNDSDTSLTYPAAYPGVIGVAATDQSDGIASFSNRSSAVDVSAPGVGILSTVPGGYASHSGTSMAAPFVSAAAALLRSAAVSRGLGSVDVERVLKATAVDISARGDDSASGAGRIDPRNALCGESGCTVRQLGLTPTVHVKKRKLTVNLNQPVAQNVVLQRKVGRSWTDVTVASTSAAGTAVFRVKKGKYRVSVPRTARTLAATTKPIRVR